MRHLRLLSVLALVLSILAACSSGGSEASDKPEDPSATTTTEGAGGGDDDVPPYVQAGPNEVGSTTLALDDGRRVVVWYPTDASAADQPTEIFDIASLLSPELQSGIPAELRPQYEIEAHIGAAPADGGPFPVVLFSHGFTGFPEQSADLVTHLASWGFVVVAPNHVERSLDGLLGIAAQGVDAREGTDVLAESLDVALAASDDESSQLHGLLDGDRVAVAGHSAGAADAYLLAAADDRIDGFISYSVGNEPRDDEPEPEPWPVPDVPGMVMLGEADAIIPADASREIYEAMETPKYLVEIADAGHLVFSDICLIGRDQGGLIALADQAGLDLPENLKALATDGCQEDALDPAKAFGAIDQFSVAFLRSVFGIDAEPVGLDQATADAFAPVEITLTADPG